MFSLYAEKVPKQAYLNPQVQGAPCERWSIDLCWEFPSSNGYKLIFTAICPFSKFAVVAPIRNKEAATVARIIVENIILKFGLPFEVLSDGGKEFCNEVSDELYRMLGIKKNWKQLLDNRVQTEPLKFGIVR